MKNKYKEEFLIEQVEKNSENFVAIIVDVGSVNSENRVVYHTVSNDENDGIRNFQDFVDSILGEFSSEELKVENEKFLEKFLQNSIVEKDDFDEDSRKEWKVYNVEGVLIQCFNGFEWDKVVEKVASAIKSFDEYEKSILDDYYESQEEAKDPYGYRGLSRSDFF